MNKNLYLSQTKFGCIDQILVKSTEIFFSFNQIESKRSISG